MNDLEILLDGYIADDNINIPEKDLNFNNFYRRYSRNENNSDNNKIIPVKNIKPFVDNYISNNLWFTSNNNSFNVPNDTLIGFRDGIKASFKKGEFLSAGEIYKQELDFRKHITYSDIENSNNESKKEDAINNEYIRFINVYHESRINRSVQNYYYHVFGKYLTRNRNRPIVRFYFHLNPEKKLTEIKAFLENAIIKWFNERHIPFQLKIPFDFNSFKRADNCVIYLAQDHVFIVNDLLEIVNTKYGYLEDGNGYLLKDIPLFTFQIYPGIGFAEDPMDENAKESFGGHRCQLILNLIKDDKIIRLVDLKNKLIDFGYSEEFHKNPNSNFKYTFKAETDKYIKQINLKNSLDKKHYLYKFNETSLDYALDLIERVKFLDENSITWISYKEVNGNKFYHLLNDLEVQDIYIFLKLISSIKGNRDLFPKKILNIVYEKNSGNNLRYDLEQDFFKSFYFNLKNENYENIDLVKTVKEWYQQFYENVKENQIIFKTWFNRVIKPSKLIDVDIAKLYKMNFLEFSKKENFKIAEEMYFQFSKYEYPIKNKYYNYEYVPTNKAHIASIFLFLYCPSLFKLPDDLHLL